MHVVNTLDDARAVLRQFANGSATSARSPLEGEPNRQSDLVGGYEVILTRYARQLRKESTIWERKLWAQLKGKKLGGYKFRRQQPIGSYIADFYNAEKNIIVELDGSQHAQSAADEARDAALNGLGYEVVRVWNNEIDRDIETVCGHILEKLENACHRNQRVLPPTKSASGFGSPSRGEREPVAQMEDILGLCSPPFAACHSGVNYYRHLVDQLQREFSGVDFTFTLCCGNDPAIAHDALRMGFAHVRFDCGDAQFAELSAIAQSCGARVQRA